MTDIAIRVDHLSKLYHIGRTQQRHDTLRDALTSVFGRQFSVVSRQLHPSTENCELKTENSQLTTDDSLLLGQDPREHPLRVNGATLRVGMRPTEIERKFDEIVAFAETCTEQSRSIERFLDASLRSSARAASPAGTSFGRSGMPSARAPGVRGGRTPF